MPTIKINSGRLLGKEFSFESTVVIGRGPLADLSWNDPTVSRRHAMLTWVNDECFVSDLDSENGTLVNNKSVSDRARLTDGDQLVVGAVRATYCNQSGASTRIEEKNAILNLVEKSGSETQVVMTVDHDSVTSKGLKLNVLDKVDAVAARRLRFVERLGQILEQSFNENALLLFVLDELFDLFPQAERAFAFIWDGLSETPALARGQIRSGGAAEVTLSRTLLKDVVRKRSGILLRNVLPSRRHKAGKLLNSTGSSLSLCVPMIFRGEIQGVLQLDTEDVSTAFTKEDMELLLGISTQIAMTLAHNKLHSRLVEREVLEHDIMLAQRIQRQFLPESAPKLRDYSFAVDYSPALAVGGDFYDFLELDPEHLGVAVGDVSGKGVSAALYVAKLSSEIRFHSVGEMDPSTILERVNRAIGAGIKEGMFVTLVLVILEISTGKLTIASAGHPLPLVRKANGEVKVLGRSGGLPLGIHNNAKFEHYYYQLEGADTLVLYTDGVTEAENKNKKMFEESRLRSTIASSSGTPDDVLHKVLTGIKNFTGNTAQSDDITMLCFSRKSEACIVS